MVLPKFACDLARERLSKRHFTHATQCAAVYNPTEAVDVGYLDRTVPEDELEAVVLERAQGWLGLHPKGFAATRENCRGPIARKILDELEADLANFVVNA